MSRTDDILDKTKRKEPEAKKWKVIAGIVIGLVLVLVGWSFFISPIIEEYTSETKQIVAAYDVFESNEGNMETTVYFVGSSIIMYGIYAEEINRILSEKGYGNISVYNLGINGHYPLERALLIQNIIDSNPSLVIIGETYSMPNTKGVTEERIFLVNDRLKIRDDSLYLYSEDELRIISENRNPTFFDEKRFLSSAIKHKISDTPNKIDIESNDLFIGDRLDSENRDYNFQGVLDFPNRWRPVVTGEETRAGEAIIYNSKTLENAGIPVVLLNMPLHPLTSAGISDDTRDNFYNLLNKTGSQWYDYEYACPDDSCWNKDGLHLAPYTGAKFFAPQMAELIIELEESNVIHHS